ncbi:aldo/keto reductase [Shimia thalassica]|uniref:aldo/keto reductase n=1 Tax=Shimia thalassica TaxID=1715693 RepID=UPI001C0A1D48|nr:aldo/keto reductase [Shimia thalassica]MBU2945053.1 aldo/keto reductase [Shimia thalassica]MDO6504639.1 aldo/keto reductase [Shimia thalassica]
MTYTRLGQSGLIVSRLALGTMTFTYGSDWIPGVAKVGETEAGRMVDTAFETGVNLFDTADGYSNGEAETILGKSLAGKREKAVVCTKIGFRNSDHIPDAGLSRSQIFQQVEKSLTRLNTDWIDLLVLHKTDFTTPLEETLRALQALIDSGKVRYIGCSNWPAWQVARAIQFQRDNGMDQFIAGQYLYNAVARDIESDVLKMADAMGLGLMAWSPLAAGVLTGKYDLSKPDQGEGRLAEGDFLQISPQHAQSVLAAVSAVAEAHNATSAQIALAWILNKRRDHTVIIGASKQSQLEASLAAASLTLSQAEIDAIDGAMTPARRYPAWFDDMMTDELHTKVLS